MDMDIKYIEKFTNMMSEGFIVIDSQGIIKIYNDRAKEIFGINLSLENFHKSGTLKKGDFILIGDNSLGSDDGCLSGEDLKQLGIESSEIDKSDGFIFIGKYKDKNFKPVFQIIHKDEKNGVYHKSYNDFKVRIDFDNREIDIFVKDKKYNMRYIKSMGHMLILDDNKEVKFFQHYGYTARNEGIKDILDGKTFLSKENNNGNLEVIGEAIRDIHKGKYIMDKFIEVAQGSGEEEYFIEEEINGISTLCSVLKVIDEDKVVGAALKVEDISEIEKVNKEKNKFYEELKMAEEKLLLQERLNDIFPNFVGTSVEIQKVKKLALKASKVDSNLLILGKSGTGKSVLAKYIHENSDRKNEGFIEINCGAIPVDLLESELFGYVKGAFTGAMESGKKGLFQMADKGSIFLDEIGDLPKNLQVKILNIIQNKTFYPLGSTKKEKVDVRIIGATNKNLEEEMFRGEFREDLYYRINVFPIYIPELKERKEDIYDLVDLILPEICRRHNMEKTISPEAMKKLMNYQWPGNIRELENILERAVMFTDGNIILSKDIKIKDNIVIKSNNFKEQIEEKEKIILKNAIENFNGDKKKAMDYLEMSRSNFYKKLKDYDIN